MDRHPILPISQCTSYSSLETAQLTEQYGLSPLRAAYHRWHSLRADPLPEEVPWPDGISTVTERDDPFWFGLHCPHGESAAHLTPDPERARNVAALFQHLMEQREAWLRRELPAFRERVGCTCPLPAGIERFYDGPLSLLNKDGPTPPSA